MYGKLISRNTRKYIGKYLVYIVTIIIGAMLFYGFTSLSTTQLSNLAPEKFEFSNLYTYLNYVTVIISLFLVILIIYVNRFIIKTRSSELAIYTLLGIESKKIAIMFTIQLLLISIVSVALGIIIGIFFSTFLVNIILNSINVKHSSMITISWIAAIRTIIFYILIFIFIAFRNVQIISKKSIRELMSLKNESEDRKHKKDYVYILTLIVGISCYICAYIMIIKYRKIEDLVYIDISVKNRYILTSIFSVIAGTYLFFYSFGFFLSKLRQKFDYFKYKNLRVLILGNVFSKINTNSKLMATITLTLMASMMSFSLGPILSDWIDGFNDHKAVFDIQLNTIYSLINEKKDMNKLVTVDFDKVTNYLEKNKIRIKDSCRIEYYFINSNDFFKRKVDDFPALAIKLSDYNKLLSLIRESPIRINDNEYTTQWNLTCKDAEIEAEIKDKANINVSGKKYPHSNKYYKKELGESIYNKYTDVLIILPDSACEELDIGKVGFYIDTYSSLSYKMAEEIEDYIAKFNKREFALIYDKYHCNVVGENEEVTDVISIRMKTKQDNVAMIFSLLLRMIFLYLGVILLIIALTIISLQQLTDFEENKLRCKILYKIGTDIDLIKKTVNYQVLTFFLIPSIISIFGWLLTIKIMIMAFNNEINAYVGWDNYWYTIKGVGIISICIYIIYLFITMKLYSQDIIDYKISE
ncbi:MAG: FtsX-like permease family protein [Clostridiaceae bacterium]|nr:FtsX-like permease family protein [Clostridiaceae bacterium]MBW4859510.1 FtsX-like permease family protein [Clostridiaceae bacterium]MBW4867355.1 FtsX-like permease family protein [Clostridiaceae bacterium]